MPPTSTFISTVTTGASESWTITTLRPLDSVARFTLSEAAWITETNPFKSSNPRTKLLSSICSLLHCYRLTSSQAFSVCVRTSAEFAL